MVVYLLCFLATMIFSYFFLHYRESHEGSRFSKTFDYKFYNLILFLIVIFPLWFITAFRYDVGTDYFYTYVKYFEHTGYGWKPYKYEPLFQLLNTVLVSLQASYVWLFAISGFIILFFIFYYIFKYSPRPLYSIAVFLCSSFFFNSLNNVRQYIAIAIAIIGFSQKRTLKAITIMLIATLFHLTASFYILLYLVTNLIVNKPIRAKKMIILSLVACVLAPIVCIVLKRIILMTPYAYFLETSQSGYSVMIIIVNIFIYLFALFYYDNKDKTYQKFTFLQLITVLCCICSVFLQNEEMWMRIIRMPAIFQLIFLPKIFLREKNKGSRIIVASSLLIVYSIYTIYTVYINGGLEVFPYQFIFGNI